ncbi:hypothetical protein Glove_261g6 [Diversispora epigaea]|uniref:RING-type domain-containing protein n=1 Tax=Diversispora epigaea TaxID=1348612 RepID=A0A397ID14_9GLOM|nr:hypothetical protein Glove_261g6 [Diversispora epigaea]
MSEREPYTGYSVVPQFLKLNRDIIISSLSVNFNWNDIDRTWTRNFLREAENFLDQKNFADLKEKSAGSGGGIGYVNSEQHGQGLQVYWNALIKDYKKTQLKGFVYKIIYYKTPERIQKVYKKSDLCGVCREELHLQLTKHITILTCGHLFHWQCLEHSINFPESVGHNPTVVCVKNIIKDGRCCPSDFIKISDMNSVDEYDRCGQLGQKEENYKIGVWFAGETLVKQNSTWEDG